MTSALYLTTNKNQILKVDPKNWASDFHYSLENAPTRHLVSIGHTVVFADQKGCLHQYQKHPFQPINQLSFNQPVVSLYASPTNGHIYVGLLNGEISVVMPSIFLELHRWSGFGSPVTQFSQAPKETIYISHENGTIRRVDPLTGDEYSRHQYVDDGSPEHCCCDADGFVYVIVNRTLTRYYPDGWLSVGSMTFNHGHLVGVYGSSDHCYVIVVNESGVVSQVDGETMTVRHQFHIPGENFYAHHFGVDRSLYVSDSMRVIHQLSESTLSETDRYLCLRGFPVAIGCF